MIITDSKPYGLLKTMFSKSDKIGIVSCNTCAKMCETGGQKGMDRLAKRLKDDDFNVVGKKLISIACDLSLIKKEEIKGDVIIALTCDAGVYALKKLLPNKKIITALDTIGLGAFDNKMDISLVRKFE